MGLNIIEKAIYAPFTLEHEEAQNLSKACSAAQLISVALVVKAVVFALFGGPLGLLFAGLTVVAAHDFYRATQNLKEIADGRVQAFSNLSSLVNHGLQNVNAFVNQPSAIVGKDTWVLKQVLEYYENQK